MIPTERALARSWTTGDGKVRFGVEDLAVEHRPGRGAVLTYRLSVGRRGHRDERWLVTLPWEDSSFADVLTSPAPAPDRLRLLVRIVRALLEEWWDTKGHNRRSAKLGHRLPSVP